MLIHFISWLFWLLNVSICSTLKYKVNNEPSAAKLFAVWHGQSFPLFYWAQHRKLCIFPIETWRGNTIEYLAKKYKYKTVRLKTKGTPLERSDNFNRLKNIILSGYESAIAVDGPPEPLVNHKAKSGILLLSKKTGVPIVSVGINMKGKLNLFWRWDKYEIPLPFSTVEIRFGEPFLPDEKATTQSLEESLLVLFAESQSGAN